MTKTAVILFAHLPSFESRSKSLSSISSKKATQKISGILTEHFYTLAKQTSADTFLIDSYHQKGKSFGERITNAFADVYAKGYENIVCIGNDCPDLSLSVIQNAISLTEKGIVVLGPTQDGGAYLIGIPKQSFDSNSLLKIKWQCRKTYKELSKSFVNQNIIEFSVLKDIDSENDLLQFSNRNKLVSILINEIAKFLHQLNSSKNLNFTFSYYFKCICFRGPPLLLNKF